MTIITNNKSIDDCIDENIAHPNISFLNSKFNVYYEQDYKCYYYMYSGVGFYYVPIDSYHIDDYNIFSDQVQDIINTIESIINYDQLYKYNMIDAYTYLFCKNFLPYFKQNKEYSIIDHELASLIFEKINNILDICSDVSNSSMFIDILND